MNTLFIPTVLKQIVITAFLGMVWFGATALSAHATTDADRFAHMEAQLDEATTILDTILASLPAGDVLGISTTAVDTSLTPSKDKNVIALQAQLKALMLQRDNLNKKVAEINAQIVVLRDKIQQITNPVPLKPTPRFNGLTADGTPLVSVSAVFEAPKRISSVTGPVVLGKINWGDSDYPETVSALVTGAQMFVDLKHTYKAAGTYVITLTDLNGKTATQKVVVNPITTKAPVCDSFTANPISLPVGGGNVTFAWATTNATAVSINQSVGTVPVDGSKVVPVTTSKTFTLVASNATGASATCSVTVTVKPSVVTEPLLYSVSTSETLKLNSDAVSTDDSGEFIIKFEVTATDSDVYVPRTAGRDFTNSKSNGVNFGVYNATYIDVTTGSTTQTLTSTADIEGAYFVVQEGETETFTVIVNFDPATPGFYRVGLKSLNWKSKVTVPDISINTRTVFDPVAFRTKVLAI